MRNGMNDKFSKLQVNSNNVLSYMGKMEEQVQALLIETGNIYDVRSASAVSMPDRAHERVPSILNENDFANRV